MNYNSFYRFPLLGEQKKDPFSFVLNFILYFFIIVMFAWLVFINLFILCPISGDSMLPTYVDKDFVLLNKSHTYKSNDVVVLDATDTEKTTRLIKRIIFTEGDEFKILYENNIYKLYKNIDGVFTAINEPYIKENMTLFSSTFFKINTTYKVPKDKFFYLGDNRNISKDSRHYGYADKSDIVGIEVFHPEKDSFLENLLVFLFYRSSTETVLNQY